MAKKKVGLINRILMGSEKSEGYARSTLPSNRWELFWDIFKGRFWKLVLVNLLILVFFLPLLFLLFMHSVVLSGYGTTAPFAQCFGVGYQAVPSLIGYSENIILKVNMSIYLFLPIVAIFASFGVAGGAYIIRNMVWTEGIFVANDFWHGIKNNIKQIILIALIYSLLFYASEIAFSFYDKMIATGQGVYWLIVVMKILLYAILAFITIMALHMITMCVTYELKFTTLIKNSFLFTIGLAPHSVLFILLGILPEVFIYLGSTFSMIGYLLLILFGFSFFLLVWTNFCQWAYDTFVNDKVPGAQKNRGIYEKVSQSNSKSLQQYKEQLARTVRTSLNSKPIKPITDDELKLAELPQSFNRGDLEKLNESKRVLYEDNERYIEEHKNDPEFAPTEEELKLMKDKETRDMRIEKAKKELEKHKKLKK